MDDFFGRDGIFARLFAYTLEQMLEAKLSEHLWYEPYDARGRNSGKNRNGRYSKKVRTSSGDISVQVPRDRKGTFEPKVIKKFASNTNELESFTIERINDTLQLTITRVTLPQSWRPTPPLCPGYLW